MRTTCNDCPDLRDNQHKLKPLSYLRYQNTGIIFVSARFDCRIINISPVSPRQLQQLRLLLYFHLVFPCSLSLPLLHQCLKVLHAITSLVIVNHACLFHKLHTCEFHRFSEAIHSMWALASNTESHLYGVWIQLGLPVQLELCTSRCLLFSLHLIPPDENLIAHFKASALGLTTLDLTVSDLLLVLWSLSQSLKGLLQPSSNNPLCRVQLYQIGTQANPTDRGGMGYPQ